MAFPPQGFIIGAQKSGTTSLSGLLGQHPGIVMSEPKEPDFFNVHWERGLDWYRQCFAQHPGILVEASVSYSMARTVEWERGTDQLVPQRIFELSPQAKFIYIVRNPADRCYSAYWHDVRARAERRALREVVEKKVYYTMASYYHLQLNRYLPYFPLDRFLIVDFRKLAREPSQVAAQCAAFLGAGHREFAFAADRPKNQAFRPNRVGMALQNINGVAKLLPPSLRTSIKRLLSKDIPPLSAADRAFMMEYFRADMQAFEAQTGINFLSQQDQEMRAQGG